MEKKELPSPVESLDYQQFAKLKPGKKSDAPTDATQYQNFVYNKENIPETARQSSKIMVSGSAGGNFADGGDIETQKMIAAARGEKDQKKKKALNLMAKIKNPSKPGQKDSQLGFRTVKGKLEFYLRLGGHEVPFDVDKYGGMDILEDASSPKYQAPKSRAIREYERNFNNSSQPRTPAEKEQLQKAKQKAIAN